MRCIECLVCFPVLKRLASFLSIRFKVSKDRGEEPGADAAAYLARYGVNLSLDRLSGQGLSTARVLKRHASDTGADLLVMGAYGHPRLRERIFGRVTETMI